MQSFAFDSWGFSLNLILVVFFIAVWEMSNVVRSFYNCVLFENGGNQSLFFFFLPWHLFPCFLLFPGCHALIRCVLLCISEKMEEIHWLLSSLLSFPLVCVGLGGGGFRRRKKRAGYCLYLWFSYFVFVCLLWSVLLRLD